MIIFLFYKTMHRGHQAGLYVGTKLEVQKEGGEVEREAARLRDANRHGLFQPRRGPDLGTAAALRGTWE